MSRPAAPLEWIPGKSKARWLVGFWAVFSVSFLTAAFALDAGLSWVGVALMAPRLNLVVDYAAIGISLGPMILWAAFVPLPAPRLGVSPEGVVIDYGRRSEAFPWERAFLRGSRLEVKSRRFGIRSTYALTEYQASRVARLLPPPS